MKLLYPTSLRLRVASFEKLFAKVQSYNPTAPLPQEDLDADVLVTWQNSKANLAQAAKNMRNLKWVQSLSAGSNEIIDAGFPSSVILTSGVGLHNRTVAEHTLCLLLNAASRFYEMRDWQLERKWPAHLGGAQPDRPEGRFTTLQGANILIWGYGSIAKTLAPYLIALGANVRGAARSAGVRDGVEVLDQSQLADALPDTDALVMILPGNDSTKNALNAEMLARLPKHAWVVNVGRGPSIDHDALLQALRNGGLGGAALDVFPQEPLSPESDLWLAPNCIISPHAAGGRPQGSEELIKKNVELLQSQKPLINSIARDAARL